MSRPRTNEVSTQLTQNLILLVVLLVLAILYRWRREQKLVRLLHHSIVVIMLVITTTNMVLDAFSADPLWFTFAGAREVVIRDFAGHLTFCQSFWRGDAGYDVASHLRINSRWMDQPVEVALPFGYSPTMLFVMAPLSLMTMRWAYVTWFISSVAAVIWLTRPERTILVLGALMFFNRTGFGCLALGQTALVTAAGLVYLMSRDCDLARGENRSSARTWVDGVILWALTAKPPVAIVAGAALAANKQWRTICVAVALCGLTALLATPVLGNQWPVEYLELIATYNIDEADTAFAWSLHPDAMSNLRGVLTTCLHSSDAIASRISTGLWLLSTLAVVAARIAGKLSCTAAWAAATLSYLAFCPHVSFTEDLHLTLVLVACAANVSRGTNFWQMFAAILAVTAIYLAAPDQQFLAAEFRLPIAFLCKLAIGAVICLPATTDYDGNQQQQREMPTEKPW